MRRRFATTAPTIRRGSGSTPQPARNVEPGSAKRHRHAKRHRAPLRRILWAVFPDERRSVRRRRRPRHRSAVPGPARRRRPSPRFSRKRSPRDRARATRLSEGCRTCSGEPASAPPRPPYRTHGSEGRSRPVRVACALSCCSSSLSSRSSSRCCSQADPSFSYCSTFSCHPEFACSTRAVEHAHTHTLPGVRLRAPSKPNSVKAFCQFRCAEGLRTARDRFWQKAAVRLALSTNRRNGLST